ncbi:glycosyltransferase family 2 protein [Vagococcus entomophilus]|uniref:Glycosyl transferase family 2 n=1 Tax=Vagococcus entomophilus TaxID=1160095 RepID=A0A430AIE6_9ENTE|nr:glycosyltransferase family 2 protein [Vagococcus entomophilus]RSU07889.1 glycosyl transferase family 2 [Vagococcus entomophilus]
MKVLVIIPAYNEEENIAKTVKDLEAFKDKKENPYTIDYVVVNDGSTDGTRKVLQENNINSINLIQNLGIGGAVQTGYRYALEHDYDVAIQFDGDGQHDAAYIPTIVDPIKNGECDFVIGSRFVKKGVSTFQSSAARRTGIQIISFFIKCVSGKKIYDVTSGFRAANKKVIAEFCHRYPVDFPEPESIVHLLKKKYNISEKPVNMRERECGESSIRAFKSVKYMFLVSLAVIVSGFMKEED